jgi:hypothetical protein
MDPTLDDAQPGDEEIPEWMLDDDAPIIDEPHNLNGHIRVDDRPEIKMGKDLHRVIAEVAGAIAHDPLVYQRAHELVTIVGSDGSNPSAPTTRGTPVIRALSMQSVLPRLTRYVKFIAPKKPSKRDEDRAALQGKKLTIEWVETFPPPIVVGPFLACGDWEDVRVLTGISETPFLRLDGTVCQDRGYDSASGYFLALAREFPTIPESPTQDEAKAALARLTDVFSEFPHVSEAARMVPIAAILTILARPAIDGSIPAFVFDAATRGSGKTLQAHAVSLIALGRFASPCTFPSEDDELEKILGSYGLSGNRLVLLDNITRPFGGAPLDKCLTSKGHVDLRVLGKLDLRTIVWNALILASGNNVQFPEDTSRRSLVARLESRLENPEDRTDVRDLPAFIRSRRSELVADALIVLRSYCSHGRPSAGTSRWGSFEEWSDLIPPAIVFAGGADVMSTRPRGEAVATDEQGALAVILDRLPSLSEEPMTSKAIIQTLWPPARIKALARGDADELAPDLWDDLRDALEAIAIPRGQRTPSAKLLGERLRKLKGRVIGGRRIVAVQKHNHVSGWWVETV